MLPVLVPIIGTLVKEGLELVGNAVLAKGKDYIEEKTGVKLQPDMSSEDLRKLKEYQLLNELELAKLRQADDRLALEFYQEELKDRQSARSREVEMAKTAVAAGKPWWVPSIVDTLALLVVGGGGYSLLSSLDTEIRFALNSAIALVLGYYFGTSKSSREKDSTIHQMSGGGK